MSTVSCPVSSGVGVGRGNLGRCSAGYWFDTLLSPETSGADESQVPL
jgi:hypothetical protein